MTLFLKTYCNPNWLLSRALEKLGIKDYLGRVEFAAHFFAGCTFALAGVLWWWWISAIWAVWTLIDEFVFDGYKGKDTWIDLGSKLAGPIGFGIWKMI